MRSDDVQRFGPLVVIVVCMLVGRAMKRSPTVPNWLIAPMLTVLGLISGVATAVATGGDWRASLSSALLGLLSGAGAVGLHQGAKSIGAAARSSRPPPLPPLSVLLALAVPGLLGGCAPTIERAKLSQTAIEATSRLDPIMLGMMVDENNECLASPLPVPERERCIAKVRERWAPARAELAKVREAWCAAEPEKCGAP
jgi:hypothetical protein